jgi:polar amino acid transport system substrate-binding protein
MLKAMCAIMLLVAGTIAGTAQSAPPEVVKELAPNGKLRAAINVVNKVLAQEDPAGGEPKGITVDLSRELAKRLGVPVELVVFRGAGTVFAAAKENRWDVAYFAIEPVRAAEVDFTAPYVIIEGGYAVPSASPIKAVAEVDRPGVRIAVGQASAYDLFLTRTLKQAQLVRAPAAGARYLDLFLNEKLDVVAGVKPIVAEWAKGRSDIRVLDGAFMQIEQAMGTPKGRSAATLRYLRSFVEEMKKSGFVADALKRSNQPDAAVAPPAS